MGFKNWLTFEMTVNTCFPLDCDFQIATSMVACTFLSAPLMFVSAQMVTMPVKDTSMYSLLITETSFNISVLGICGCVCIQIICHFSN